MHSLVAEYLTPYLAGLRAIKPLYPRFGRDFLLVSVFLLALAALASLAPLLLKHAADLLGSGHATAASVSLTVAAYACAWTLSRALDWLKIIATSYVAMRCDAAFYRSLFDALQRIPLARQRHIPRGEILSDFERSRSAFGGTVDEHRFPFAACLPLAIEEPSPRAIGDAVLFDVGLGDVA